jgi:hypothetical protein
MTTQTSPETLPPQQQLTATDVRTPWRRTIALAVAAAAGLTVILLAFLWPAVTSSPAGLPVVISGNPALTEAFTENLARQSDGVMAPSTVSDRDAAVTAIARRDAYGAIVLGPTPEVLIASAANPQVSQILSDLAPTIAAQLSASSPAGTEVTVAVTDLAPLSDRDPRGIGLASSAFPLIIGGLLGGGLVALQIRGRQRRLTALASYAVVAGSAIVLVLQGWFGILTGNAFVTILAAALSLFATGALLIGLHHAIGTAGLAAGALFTMLIANPLASAAQPVEFLLGPWGEIGQWLVPGASMTLLRGTSYFPEANLAASWLALVLWAALGLTLQAWQRPRNS